MANHKKLQTSYKFCFKFDDDYIGTKIYYGTLNQCYKQYKSDCRKQVLPDVTKTLSVNAVA